MELSPIATPPQRTPTIETPFIELSEVHNRSLEISSNVSPMRTGGNLPSIRSVRNLEGVQKRYDRAFTLSWASKNNDRKDLSLEAKRSPKMTSPTTVSPLTKKNRRFVVHLTSEVDSEIHKVPIYTNEVFDIRRQNDRILKQILASKQEYQKDYNKIAQDYRFGQYRSTSVNPRVSQLYDRSLNNNSVDPSDLQAGNSSLQVSSLRGDNIRTLEETKGNDTPSIQMFNHEASSLSTLTSKANPEKINILEGLEEIYHKELKGKMHRKNRSRSFSPDKLLISNPEDAEKETIQLKNLNVDDRLMKKLKHPYSKKLPFEKPISGSIRHPLIQDLQAIETKAEILRNIKSIERRMMKEANSIANLPKIKESPSEDGAEAGQGLTKTKKRHKKKLNLVSSRKESDNLKFWVKQIIKK